LRRCCPTADAAAATPDTTAKIAMPSISAFDFGVSVVRQSTVTSANFNVFFWSLPQFSRILLSGALIQT
jgi:hypothetical protein